MSDHHPNTPHSCCCSDNGKQEEASPSEHKGGKIFKIEGLDCVEEVSILKSEIGPLVGGEENLAFDVINGRMTVLDTALPIDDQKLIKAVAATGLRATRWHPNDSSEPQRKNTQTLYASLSGLMILAGILIHLGLSGAYQDAWQWLSLPEQGYFSGRDFIAYLERLLLKHETLPLPMPEKAAYGLAILFGLRHVIVKAFYALKRFRPDMNLLMVIAITGALVINEWFEAATVSFLFALSLAIESWSIGRARHAVAALLDLAPNAVIVKTDDGQEQTLPAAEIQPGTIFVVRPGDRIALDGIVSIGEGSVNQAPISGESMPVFKQPGDEVFAGSINIDSLLQIKATKAATDTTLAHIIRLVEEAHSRRAETEQWVEKFARVYTPLVMLLALVVFLIPPLLWQADWQQWLYRALVLLVIACPCALVISTPVSIVAALASAARHGILIKGGIYIEQPAHLKAIAFDKTGTLTQGKPEITGIYPYNNHSLEEVISRAAALESGSHHPLANAIVAYAQQHGIQVETASTIAAIAGKGITGRIQDTFFWLGSSRFLSEKSPSASDILQHAQALEQQGQTVIAVGNDRHVCGLIALADQPRPHVKQAFQDLRKAGIAHLVMLTGDNKTTAKNIARQMGLDEVYAELLPQDKVTRVAELTKRYGHVAMVGDGINDAPALARASVGIAMGAMGSDAAIETADIALMSDDLQKLPWLIGHSRRTLAIIRQNIVFALTVKAAFAVLAFAGLATLWEAIAADTGASLLVVANALRLLRSRL
ncbi:heavy metal translocating P-type ATPase [methane-oxidizing endosymbiont of Gigantopelta aegis]|uniref:heavy metal translocating P-type ATPase n=1 Tax=methane-oxidizing endosymbiont of Gigantopelta aegis TaxID=2794938 RepID=UPI0018DBD5B3|nr:heavy metal translocating P-type ATPase [methane-oxidizing endosymbiont of Gigantopelta aegis]